MTPSRLLAPLALLTLAPTVACSNAQTTDLPAAGTTVPLRLLYESRATVEVMIDGRGPYLFAIETGAPVVLITAKLADELGIPGSPLPHGLRTIDSLRIGALVLRKLPVMAAQEFIPGVSGLLGLPAYKDLLLTVDYPAKLVRFERGTLGEPNGRDIFPTVMLGPFYGVDLAIAGHHYSSVIDTQSGSAIDLKPDMADSLPFVSPLVASGKVRTGAHDPVPIRSGRLAGNVVLGEFTVQQPVIGVFTPPAGAPQRALIGSRFLKNFAVTLDQRSGRVKFARANGTVPPAPPLWSVGLSLKTGADSAITAEDVRDYGPAWSRGIRNGDTIISIEGRPAQDFAWPETLGLLVGLGHSMRIEARRGAESLTFDVSPVVIVP